MAHKVKVIVGDLTAATIEKSLTYVNKLKARVEVDMELTFLSVNYSGDYPVMLRREEQVKQQNPGFDVINFYVQEYQQSTVKNNVDGYLTSFFNDNEVQQTIDDKGQVVYRKGDVVRARVRQVNTVFHFDLLNEHTGTVEQRLFVNSARNIQVIRYFEPKENKLLRELYVDTELNGFFEIGFDERKKQESFTLLRNGQHMVHSRLDLNDMWLHEVISENDVILNLDPQLAILFETWEKLENVFDLSRNMAQ